jgi:hypothetical protein
VVCWVSSRSSWVNICGIRLLTYTPCVLEFELTSNNNFRTEGVMSIDMLMTKFGKAEKIRLFDLLNRGMSQT